MARFTDFHDDLKLPAAATAQIAKTHATPEPASSASARSICTTMPQARCTACLKGQTRKPSASTTRRLESPAARSTRRTASPDQDELRQLAS